MHSRAAGAVGLLVVVIVATVLILITRQDPPLPPPDEPPDPVTQTLLVQLRDPDLLALGSVLMGVDEQRLSQLWWTPEWWIEFFIIVRVYFKRWLMARINSRKAFFFRFGIRGIGSLYYLLYAINHDVEAALAERLLSLTLAVIVASVVIHGVSVTPLMNHYEARKIAKKKQRANAES